MENKDKPYGLVMRGIAKKDKKILLLRRHPKSRNNPNRWELPGGKAELEEYFDETLIREFKEETNLDIKLGDFYEAIQNDYTHKRTVQVVMEVEILNEDVRISDEHDDWKWFSLDEIKEYYEKELLSTSLMKLLEKKEF